MKPAVSVVGIVMAVAVSACSSSGSLGPSAPGSSSAAASSSGVCDSLTAGINSAAHGSWKAPAETDNGTLHTCSFGPSDPGVLTVLIADGMSHAGFVDNRSLVASGGAVTSLSGVGDEAYTQTKGGATLVAARQGDVGVAVQLQDGSRDSAVAIARAALAVLSK